MDAKEQMQTLDGNWYCLLDAVDEFSGAVLGTALFPPASVDADRSECSAGGAA